jgi:hypothetical protein
MRMAAFPRLLAALTAASISASVARMRKRKSHGAEAFSFVALTQRQRQRVRFDENRVHFRHRLYQHAPDVLVQVHIPKCAGTSVAAWMGRAYAWGDFISYYAEHFADERVLANSLLAAWCDSVGGQRDPSRYAFWPKADQLAYDRERLDLAKDVLSRRFRTSTSPTSRPAISRGSKAIHSGKPFRLRSPSIVSCTRSRTRCSTTPIVASPKPRSPHNGPGPSHAEATVMAEDPPQNAAIPYVPMAQPTLSANVAHLTYGPAGFVLVLADQRLAPGAHTGDAPVMTNFEIGRYQLTPAAFRALEMMLADALKSYKNAIGVDLPTRDEMIARDQMPNLLRGLPPLRPPEP